MEARTCMICGTKHWSTQRCPAFAQVAAEERKLQARKVLNGVTKNQAAVTGNPVNSVTENTPAATIPVTPKAISVTNNRDGKPRKRGRPKSANPLSQAERARRYRARRAAKATQSTSAQA